jgi:glycosyltransferase involved in cell wall biosynthesis
MKIKIARIITRMDLGGAQRVVLYLSERLDSTLFEQVVITGTGGLLLRDLEKIRSVRHFQVAELNRHVGPAGLWVDIQAMRKIRQILRQEKPHLVHTHTPKAGIVGRWAARSAGVPVILHTYHGFGFSDSHGILEKQIYLWIERLTANITTRFVTVSDRNRTKGETYKIFQKQDCSVIRSGVDPLLFEGSDYSKSKKKMELGLLPSDMIVGNVASFTPSKGLHLFLQAAYQIREKMPGVRFVIAGDGTLRPQLEKLTRQFQLQDVLMMLGWRRDIPDLMRIFDVFLLTSLWEGVPRVLVEAAFSGIPIVASNVDGVPEVVEDGQNGFLVPPGDTATMANRVVTLLRDQTLRDKMGQYGSAVAARFSLEGMLQDYSHLYHDLVRTPVKTECKNPC